MIENTNYKEEADSVLRALAHRLTGTSEYNMTTDRTLGWTTTIADLGQNSDWRAEIIMDNGSLKWFRLLNHKLTPTQIAAVEEAVAILNNLIYHPKAAIRVCDVCNTTYGIKMNSYLSVLGGVCSKCTS